MAIDSSFAPSLPGLTHPFLRPGQGRTPADQRRDAAKRVTSWILVGLLHVFVVISFVISIHPFSQKGRPMVETLLMLPAPNNNSQPRPEPTPDLINKAPPMVSSAPIIIPKIPPIVQPDQPPKGAPTAGDIMGMIGRELACSPGSWEHLTAKEREVCGGAPWRAYRQPNGSLVMIPPSQLPRLKQPPPPEFTLNTGADRMQRDLQVGQDPSMGGCPIMQNTPCVHVTPNWNRTMGTGNN